MAKNSCILAPLRYFIPRTWTSFKLFESQIFASINKITCFGVYVALDPSVNPFFAPNVEDKD